MQIPNQKDSMPLRSQYMSSIDIESNSDVERYNTAVVKESTIDAVKEGGSKLNTSENFFDKSNF